MANMRSSQQEERKEVQSTMAITIAMDCFSSEDHSPTTSIHDVVMRMKKQEKTTYKQVDDIPADMVGIINPNWRREILEWMYGVVGYCKIPRESVATAAYFIDVSVANGLVESRIDYQVVAMTALHLTLKLLDSSMLRLSSLIKLNRGFFDLRDVEDMEWRMLVALNWYTHPPTPGCFLQNFLLLLPRQTLPETRRSLEQITLLLAEIAVCQPEFRNYTPSTIAFAGMAVAIDLFDDCELPVWQRHYFLFKMATVARMKSTSIELEDAVQDLQPYLAEHAKLRDLVLKIGSWNRQARLDSYDFEKTPSVQNSSASPRQSAVDF